MTIDRAIEILTSDKTDVLISSIADLRAAQQLGIEALKWIATTRAQNNPSSIPTLPGETRKQ